MFNHSFQSLCHNSNHNVAVRLGKVADAIYTIPQVDPGFTDWLNYSTQDMDGPGESSTCVILHPFHNPLDVLGYMVIRHMELGQNQVVRQFQRDRTYAQSGWELMVQACIIKTMDYKHKLDALGLEDHKADFRLFLEADEYNLDLQLACKSNGMIGSMATNRSTTIIFTWKPGWEAKVQDAVS